jgi:DNA adenine methylase
MSSDITAMLFGLGMEEVREKYLKLPFSWPGGKYESLHEILPHLPIGKAFCEPFGGSGAVILNRFPTKLDVYNDRYGGVTDFFRVVRDPKLFPFFMDRINLTIHSREEFIWCKSTWKNCEDPIERAARWYYIARFAVNGKVTSTFGRSKDPKVRFCDRLHTTLPLFYPIHTRFKTIQVENLDWRQCIDDYDQPGMVWYFDPTYLDTVRTYENELSLNDHKELVFRISQMSSFVAVSSYDTKLTREIYDKSGIWDDRITWQRKTTALSQAFTGTNNLDTLEQTSSRGTVTEMLWIRKAR